MVHKKVDSIELDGQYYMAEFNDAVFGGDISALYGTFSGTLDVNSLDVVHNITIAGLAISASWAVTVAAGNWSEGGSPGTTKFHVFATVVLDIPDGVTGTLKMAAHSGIKVTGWNNQHFHNDDCYVSPELKLNGVSQRFFGDSALNYAHTFGSKDLECVAQASIGPGLHTVEFGLDLRSRFNEPSWGVSGTQDTTSITCEFFRDLT